MKVLKIALVAAAASMAMAGAASAAEVSFNLGVASDYVFRGLTQTRGDTQVFGGADVTSGMIYGGVWASNVDFDSPLCGFVSECGQPSVEVDFYAGVKPTLGPVSLDIGAIYYAYIDEPSDADLAYWELKLAGSVPVGPATVGAAVYYSPELSGNIGEGVYYEANAAYTFENKATLSGAIGIQELDETDAGLDNYTTWNVGVSYPITDAVTVDARYIGTDDEAKDFYGTNDLLAFTADDKIVATLKLAF